MKSLPILTGCRACRLSRRRFLAAGSAACAGVASLAAPSTARDRVGRDPLRIRVLYSLHAAKQDRPDWPNAGFDFAPEINRIESALGSQVPTYEFVTAMANGPEQAREIVERDKPGEVDGYIVFQMNCWNRVVQTVAETGKPVLYADFQFGGSGGFLVYTAAFLRNEARNVGFVASSRMSDLIAAVKCFEEAKAAGPGADFAAMTAEVRLARTPRAGSTRGKPDAVPVLATGECMRRMGESRILAVGDERAAPAPPVFGIPLEYISFAELNDAWKAADPDESKAVAERWRSGASEVVGVSRETLETSAAMYLGMKSVLKKHGANAITVNCLGGFYGGHIHAYPCLGFHELNNEGLVGACECDIRSTATMTAFTTLTQGRPGFISDPVIDTARRRIVYAHCVAANRVFGPSGSANPYVITTHSEDRQGASVRSVLPVGYVTTTLEVLPERKEILFHRAMAMENDPDDRACRTKLSAEPLGDLEKLFREWDRWGWHRVTFYGDLENPARALADVMGWRVVSEA